MSTKSNGPPNNGTARDPVPPLGSVRIRKRPANYDAHNGNNPPAPAQASNNMTTSVQKVETDERARKMELVHQPVDPTSTTAKTENRSGDYEVGYKKPPLSTRFKKGWTGNPKGRPKGSRNLRTIFEEESQLSVAITVDGRNRRISKQGLAIKTMINQAAKGDPRAMQMYVKLAEKFGWLAVDDQSSADDPAASLKTLVSAFRYILNGDETEDPSIGCQPPTGKKKI